METCALSRIRRRSQPACSPIAKEDGDIILQDVSHHSRISGIAAWTTCSLNDWQSLGSFRTYHVRCGSLGMCSLLWLKTGFSFGRVSIFQKSRLQAMRAHPALLYLVYLMAPAAGDRSGEKALQTPQSLIMVVRSDQVSVEWSGASM